MKRNLTSPMSFMTAIVVAIHWFPTSSAELELPLVYASVEAFIKLSKYPYA